ncbi:hypothetical protein L6R53_19180 [Myxococcota bacterium]|nr:hypothetical protein [Myxococcota bacterium]
MRALAIPWGIGGSVALLVDALRRLVPVAFEGLSADLSAPHLVFLAVWLPGMAWAEGYRGFHQRFAPRLVARALHLRDRPHPVRLLLAPAFCMGLFHATRRRVIATWALFAGIVALVLVVRELPQPWRGLVDLGVVVGLGIGTASILWHTARALGTGGVTVDPELPATACARAGG